MREGNIAQRRPAESATLIAAGIVAVCGIVGVEVSTEAVIAILVAIGAIPAFVTGLVERFR